MIGAVRLHLVPLLLAFALLLVPASCRSAARGASATGPTAECPVCKHEGDLACVCVHVEPDTPRCECAGEVYYFCSDECRADFQRHPERYAPRATR
jgi:YHS domain-containing protein